MDNTRKAQAFAYGRCWTFTVDADNGHVMATLTVYGKRGATLFYNSWAEALQDIAPIHWTHVFVTVGN